MRKFAFKLPIIIFETHGVKCGTHAIIFECRIMIFVSRDAADENHQTAFEYHNTADDNREMVFECRDAGDEDHDTGDDNESDVVQIDNTAEPRFRHADYSLIGRIPTQMNRISIVRNAVALAALALLCIGIAANAQTYIFFPNDTTIDYAVNTNYAIVGYASGDFQSGFINPSSPTISLVSGGSITSDLYAKNSSTINISNGSILSNDSIGGYLYAYDSSNINVNSGIIRHSLVAFNSSIVNFSGGSIGDNLHAFNNSIIYFSGGSVAAGISVHDNCNVSVYGGYINDYLLAEDNSIVKVYGGNFADDARAEGSGNLTISGGNFVGILYAKNSSTLNLLGTDLAATLTNPAYKDPHYNIIYSLYTLSGRLIDGTDMGGKQLLVQNGTGAKFTLTNFNAIAPVTGQIALDGVADLTKIVTPVGNLTFEFRAPSTLPYNPGNPPPAPFTKIATLTANTTNHGLGDYTLPGVPPGVYDIAIKSRNSLRAVVKKVTIDGIANGIAPVLLLGGDATNNNIVDFDDFLALLNAFGAKSVVPGSAYDAAADFNYDGIVDFDDFLILLGNFGFKGAL